MSSLISSSSPSSTKDNSSRWSELTIVILDKIGQYLNPFRELLLIVELTCKSWHKCGRLGCGWSSLSFEDNWTSSLTNGYDSTVSINKQTILRESRHVTLLFQSITVQRLSCIRHLEFVPSISMTQGHLNNLISRITGLRSLTAFVDDRERSTENKIQSFPDCLKELQELKIEYEDRHLTTIIIPPHMCKSLRDLSISSMKNKYLICLFTNPMVSLNALHVRGNLQLTSDHCSSQQQQQLPIRDIETKDSSDIIDKTSQIWWPELIILEIRLPHTTPFTMFDDGTSQYDSCSFVGTARNNAPRLSWLTIDVLTIHEEEWLFFLYSCIHRYSLQHLAIHSNITYSPIDLNELISPRSKCHHTLQYITLTYLGQSFQECYTNELSLTLLTKLEHLLIHGDTLSGRLPITDTDTESTSVSSNLFFDGKSIGEWTKLFPSHVKNIHYTLNDKDDDDLRGDRNDSTSHASSFDILVSKKSKQQAENKVFSFVNDVNTNLEWRITLFSGNKSLEVWDSRNAQWIRRNQPFSAMGPESLSFRQEVPEVLICHCCHNNIDFKSIKCVPDYPLSRFIFWYFCRRSCMIQYLRNTTKEHSKPTLTQLISISTTSTMVQQFKKVTGFKKIVQSNRVPGRYKYN